MFSSAERACIIKLSEGRHVYMNYFKGKPEYELLKVLFSRFDKAEVQYRIQVLQATPMPTKPLDAYIAGGIANGLGGAIPAIATFSDAKERERRYEQAINQYHSTLKGINGASGELAFCYGSIVSIIKTNAKAAARWENTVTEINDSIRKTEASQASSKFIFAMVISLIIALFFGGIIGLGTGDITAFLCVGGCAFAIAWIYLMIKM